MGNVKFIYLSPFWVFLNCVYFFNSVNYCRKSTKLHSSENLSFYFHNTFAINEAWGVKHRDGQNLYLQFSTSIFPKNNDTATYVSLQNKKIKFNLTKAHESKYETILLKSFENILSKIEQMVETKWV